MKIQYASDLHLEFPQNKHFLKHNPLKPVGDILVLPGDIVPFASIDKHQDFFSYLSDHFEITYWLPGNHEYYQFDIADKATVLNEKIRENVFLVNNTSVIHGNAKLIFSTLWSHISPGNHWHIERILNDFHAIKFQGRRFTADNFNQIHQESLAYIQTELNTSNAYNTAIFSHHCPTFMNYPEQYKGDILNEAFAVELYNLIETSGISNWVYGHHHFNGPEFTIGQTTLRTNQLGYVQRNEHKRFNPIKYVEL